MDPAKPPPFLQRAIERLARAFAPERLVLFGSQVKGSAHPGSDVDLLVIADLPGDPAAHLRRARQLVADLFPPVDVVFCTPEEVANAATARSPFLQSVLESGVTVYRRMDSQAYSALAGDGDIAMQGL
jgi:predicted nucleotidyltransferase